MTSESRGYLEDSYFTFTFAPIPGPDGRFVGCQYDYTDRTPVVLQRNRDKVLDAITFRAGKVRNLANLWTNIIETLEAESQDISYAIIYSQLPDHQSPFQCSYLAGFGLDVTAIDPTPTPGLATVFSRLRATIELLQTNLATLPPELAVTVPKGTVSSAYIMSINSANGVRIALMVLGMNPKRSAGESRSFVTSLLDGITRSVDGIRLPEEKRLIEEANLLLSAQLTLAKVKAEKNEQTIERLGRNCPAGMFIIGPEGQPIYANDTYIKLLHLDREKWLATPAGEFAWDDSFEDVESVKTLLADLLTGTPAPFQIRVKGLTDGLPSWIEGIAFSELGEDGKVVSVQGWLYDISHRVFAESLKDERLREAIANKEATGKFLDMISHEIRNPLSSILLLAHEIQRVATVDGSAISADGIGTIADAANTILLCAQHQKVVVDDVLELSRMDSGLLQYSLETASPTRIVQETLKMFAADLKAADIKVNVEFSTDYPEFISDGVMLDPHRLTQVLINIITNAMKFTKMATVRKITISCEASKTTPAKSRLANYVPRNAKRESPLTSSDAKPNFNCPAGTIADDDVYLFFSVQDSGQGITKTELTSLFDRFSQASPKTYKQYGGSGLGLFICRELVELHGGQIGVQSVAAKGSNFFCYIRAFRPPPTTSGAQASFSRGKVPPLHANPLSPETARGTTLLSRSDLSVLLVEDNVELFRQSSHGRIKNSRYS